jgi:threonine dehydrogenase-like Zn-dependent dehydrogenase
MVVDTHKDRLALAEQVGAVPIDDTEGGGLERIMELTGGRGADCGCECVGYQCCNMHQEEVPNLTLNNLVNAVKFTGRIGAVGVFVPQDPNAKDALQRRGQIAFDYGMFWFKGQKIGTGQVLQPLPQPAHRAGEGQALLDRVARTAARGGAGGVQELRRAQGRLDQGDAGA